MRFIDDDGEGATALATAASAPSSASASASPPTGPPHRLDCRSGLRSEDAITEAQKTVITLNASLVAITLSIGALLVNIGGYLFIQRDHERRIIEIEVQNKSAAARYAKEREEIAEIKIELRHLRLGVEAIQRDLLRLMAPRAPSN